ncbi:22834_t:CDS:2, partial [Gigaspora margarita]
LKSEFNMFNTNKNKRNRFGTGLQKQNIGDIRRRFNERKEVIVIVAAQISQKRVIKETVAKWFKEIENAILESRM